MIREFFGGIFKSVSDKILQYVVSVGGGLLVAFETSVPYFVPCFLAVVLDVISAFYLGRRMHKKYPDRADGKFKSEYKYRILYTMIIIFVLVIIAAYVDMLIIKNGDMGVRAVLCVFLFYQGWSILENWSSENDNKIARALQRIMVNKAERHINVPLADILLGEKKDEHHGKG